MRINKNLSQNLLAPDVFSLWIWWSSSGSKWCHSNHALWEQKINGTCGFPVWIRCNVVTNWSVVSEPNKCFFLRTNWMCFVGWRWTYTLLWCVFLTWFSGIGSADPALFPGVFSFLSRRWRSRPSLLSRSWNFSLGGFFLGEDLLLNTCS